ncbi:MAG: hypothetical protein RLZZ324_651 [Candidatus Parcubacteria bacterium]|jgi:hypothetical protein
MTPTHALLALIPIVILVWLVRRGVRQRRTMLVMFDRAVRAGDVTDLRFAQSDDTPTTSIYGIEGMVRGVSFVFEAVEKRNGETYGRYSLRIIPNPSLSRDEYGFGAECIEGEDDQLPLALMFLRLWPVGNYPCPALPKGRDAGR